MPYKGNLPPTYCDVQKKEKRVTIITEVISHQDLREHVAL